jgi:DNA-binding CsgD family transcriptional regulator
VTDFVADLAEVAASKATIEEFRREAFRILEASVGFDYGIVWRTDAKGGGSGMTVGFPTSFFEHYKTNEARYEPELAPVLAAASSNGVAVDTHVLTASQRDRMAFYSEIIRPIGSRAYMTGLLEIAGEPIGIIQLGRTSPSFGERSIERLHRLLPVLALGERLRDQSPLLNVALSRREREIIDYVSLGFTNADIARACGTSRHTVRNQLHKLFEKLGVSSRAELVGLLRR